MSEEVADNSELSEEDLAAAAFVEDIIVAIVTDSVVEEVSGAPSPVTADMQQLVARKTSSPFPDPATLREYIKLKPNAADIIFDEFPRESAHRRSLDHKLADTARRSLDLTSVLSAVTIVAAVVLGLNDHAVLAGIFGVGGFSPVLLGMIKGDGVWTGRGRSK